MIEFFLEWKKSDGEKFSSARQEVFIEYYRAICKSAHDKREGIHLGKDMQLDVVLRI